MDELISRQAAITQLSHNKNKGDEEWKLAVENDIRTIWKLPSAEPKIIRCKDCKHWIPYDWMFSEVWQSRNIADYQEDEMGCKWCDMSMKANDFCSRADRREVTNGN